MTSNFGLRLLAGAALAALLSTSAHAVSFRLVKQLDMAALNAREPGSVAAYGNDLYVGTLFGGAQLYHIANPLGAPSLVNTFGGINNPLTNGGLPSAGTTSNGYVSLDTDGVTLVAATDNGGNSPDIAQSYDLVTDVFNWGNHGVALGMQNGGTIDGAAVDPTTGHVMLTCFGCDDQNFRNASTGAPEIIAGENVLFSPGVGTGWKDVSYDQATGDIYLRAWGGVARGKQLAPGQFQTLEAGAGVQTIVDNVNNNFRSAINVEFLPTDFAGEPLVILNDRDEPTATFGARVKVFSATPPSVGGTATDTPVAASFFGLDGVTPFTTAASNGIYDFSYDPINKKLYVSDHATSQVHVFGVIPEPTTLVLAGGMALLMAGTWRRGR